MRWKETFLPKLPYQIVVMLMPNHFTYIYGLYMNPIAYLFTSIEFTNIHGWNSMVKLIKVNDPFDSVCYHI